MLQQQHSAFKINNKDLINMLRKLFWSEISKHCLETYSLSLNFPRLNFHSLERNIFEMFPYCNVANEAPTQQRFVASLNVC